MSTQVNQFNSGLESNDDELDFEKIIKDILKNWKLFIISLFCCLFLSIGYLRYTTSTYKIKSKLLIDDQSSGTSSVFNTGSSLTSTFSDLFNVQSNVDNEVEILKTNDLMEKKSLWRPSTWFTKKES